MVNKSIVKAKERIYILRLIEATLSSISVAIICNSIMSTLSNKDSFTSERFKIAGSERLTVLASTIKIEPKLNIGCSIRPVMRPMI